MLHASFSTMQHGMAVCLSYDSITLECGKNSVSAVSTPQPHDYTLALTCHVVLLRRGRRWRLI